MNKNKFSTKYLVEMALLVAIILLMAFTPIEQALSSASE